MQHRVLMWNTQSSGRRNGDSGPDGSRNLKKYPPPFEIFRSGSRMFFFVNAHQNFQLGQTPLGTSQLGADPAPGWRRVACTDTQELSAPPGLMHESTQGRQVQFRRRRNLCSSSRASHVPFGLPAPTEVFEPSLRAAIKICAMSPQ